MDQLWKVIAHLMAKKRDFVSFSMALRNEFNLDGTTMIGEKVIGCRFAGMAWKLLSKDGIKQINVPDSKDSMLFTRILT